MNLTILDSLCVVENPGCLLGWVWNQLRYTPQGDLGKLLLGALSGGGSVIVEFEGQTRMACLSAFASRCECIFSVTATVLLSFKPSEPSPSGLEKWIKDQELFKTPPDLLC